MIPPNLSDLPHSSGCYLYRDSEGTIIYVGKAKDLKRRVSSYFQKRDHDPKTRRLVETLVSVEYIVTGTDEEAYLLENTLIKKYQPKFNIDLRDAKTYAYIELTREPFPRIGIARSKKGNGKFFGPFVSARERDYVLSVVKKTFRLRSCVTMPKRACLRYHIGYCTAPCIGQVTEEEYQKQCRYAADVLKGNTGELIAELQQEMEAYSANLQFEEALRLRDVIGAVKSLSERQYVTRKSEHNEDVAAYRVVDGTVYLMVFHVYKGTLSGRDEFIFEYSDGFFEEFLPRYYAENTVPNEIITEHEPDESLALYLENLSGHKVTLTCPKAGAKKKLLELAGTNIETVHFGCRMKVLELQKALHLKTAPEVIECFDISHLSGTDTVASMVQFRSGRPDKRNYRRYKVKTVEGVDDFASMREVVGRRYRRLLDEDEDLPDLILIDGGKGQLSFAKQALDAVGADIPVVALAESEEEVFAPGIPFPLPFDKKTKANRYLQEIRDEAHRFAITYNRLLRSKRVVGNGVKKTGGRKGE
ncbi:MAG: excinuclease ABC subunit UvrC [Methanocorpusculum sp.]|nr:excinuclease ABC subunit UvrC [Methanocorpusculum sp.]